MSEPFVAEIRLFSFSELPAGWAPCQGQELAIAEHQPLFSLLGWRHGGDRRSTFALPAMAEDAQLTFAIATNGFIPPRESEDQMDQPYVGEIRLFGGAYAPAGWVPCDGRELPIEAPNLALFAMIGHAFGGGPNTFAVPDLRERAQAGLHFIIAVSGNASENGAHLSTLSPGGLHV